MEREEAFEGGVEAEEFVSLIQALKLDSQVKEAICHFWHHKLISVFEVP